MLKHFRYVSTYTGHLVVEQTHRFDKKKHTFNLYFK